jgi:simple sugar transport system permease protein
MTEQTLPYAGPRSNHWTRRFVPGRQYVPLIMTALVFLAMYATCAFRYTGFFTPRVFEELFSENAVVGVVAIGMTFVILSGGIDLSVGSVIGLTTILVAVLVRQYHWHPAAAISVALALGTLLGLAMGCLIHFFQLAPFLVTLGGMFFARGVALLISEESVGLSHPLVVKLTMLKLQTGFAPIKLPTFVFLGVAAIGAMVAAFTRFGRNVYAIGGNEQSAVLMGLPVARTKISIYALSGFCSALAGVLFVLKTSSGNAAEGAVRELDAIAAVVIGGTLLTGGVGFVWGTVLGVLILGLIDAGITFEGTLNSWWTKIVIGFLLLVFISLQRLLVGASMRRSA